MTGKNTTYRPSAYNAFLNSAFRGVQNNTIPHWDITGTVNGINTSEAVFQERHQVVELSIPAGAIVRLSPNNSAIPKALRHQYASFGAYVKTNIANQAFASATSYSTTCIPSNSSFHPGDNDWHYIGLPIGINANACAIDASFIFDNSTSPNAATVAITCPSFVFGNTRPSLLSQPLLRSGGIVNGTLSTSMMNFPIVVNEQLELTLPPDANTFYLTGNNAIHRLNNNASIGRRFPKGTVLHLIFESAGVTLRNWAFINLLGDANYTSTTGSSLSLSLIHI